ncbi:MAG: aminopeptidase, partial [Ruminococcus sp.]|nr:aminopeptidase [Ruminococcus sp.]
MDENKSISKELKEKLFMKRENGYRRIDDAEEEKIFSFAEDYKKFLDSAKTEREAVCEAVKLLESNGFVEYKKGMELKAGGRIYRNNRGKAVIMAVIGTAPIGEGVRLCAAHIDSPRLDLKQNPLYEDSELALFKTHYYGGIKKYQWTTVPLSLHGVILKADGTSVNVNIGENENDPVFCVTDLLPHLATEQMSRTAGKIIRGEDLNLLIGSIPFRDDETSESVKLNIMNILFEKYGITESDFISAELEAVPAFKARDIGFDRSLIGGYGHDDRCCAYPALRAAVECSMPVHT